MKTYQQFADYLGKKQERPLANNTRVRLVEPGKIAVRLHNTDVVVLDELGNVTLNSGGWKTSTTKARINEFSPVAIWQSKGVWSFNAGGKGYIFADGVTIHSDGSVSGDQPVTEQEQAKALRKQINAYAAKCAAAVPLELPGTGDCLFCRCFDQAHSFGGTEHLQSHMDEGYVVPSLVYSALTAAGYDPHRQVAHAIVFGQGGSMSDSFGKDAAKRSVRKYLLRRFALA